MKAELIEISKRCSALEDLDKQLPDEILGYNEPLLFKGNDFKNTDVLKI